MSLGKETDPTPLVTPAVSVVICLYNKARHIRRSVESVLEQSYPDFELVVVDDGSTDGGGDVVRKIMDPRLRLVVQPNAGECAARNRGIAEAKGELIAFLDADDKWYPWFLETVIDLWRRYPDAGAFASAFEFFDGTALQPAYFGKCVTSGDGGLLDDYFASAYISQPVCSSAVMIPKKVFDAVGAFPDGIKRAGDRHMWVRIALRYRIAWSPRVSAVYHRDADNRSCLTMPLYTDPPPAEPIEVFLASSAESPASRENIAEYLAFNRLGLAKAFLERGGREQARLLVARASQTNRYRGRRRLLQFALLLPTWLIRTLLRAKRRYFPSLLNPELME